MHTPRATTHAPYPQSNHACLPPGSNHACPPEQPRMPPWGATMHPPPPPEQPCMPPPEQPCMSPPSNHACPPGSNHACLPLWTECGHTLLKILPCPNFVAGGNYIQIGGGFLKPRERFVKTNFPSSQT